MRCRREAFGGRIRQCIGCRKCCGGAFPAGQRLLPTALQLQHGRQPALRIAEATQIAVPLASVGDLAPHGGRIAEITGKLRAAGKAFQTVRGDPLVLTFRPQFQRAPERTGSIAVRMDRTESISCCQQRLPRPVRLPAQYPVLGNHGWRGPVAAKRCATNL